MNNNKYILNSIETTLSNKKLSQSDLADLIGTGRSDVSTTFKNLKEGKSITTQKLFRILNALEITLILSVK